MSTYTSVPFSAATLRIALEDVVAVRCDAGCAALYI